MELKLTNEDLKPEFKNLNASQTRFKHFTDTAQAAVALVSRAQYVAPRGDTYNAIYPTNVSLTYQLTASKKSSHGR